MPADKLLTASRTVQQGMGFTPTIDGYFFPSAPAEIFAAGKQSHIPLLAGWNSDELPYPVLMAKEKMTTERFCQTAQREVSIRSRRHAIGLCGFE